MCFICAVCKNNNLTGHTVLYGLECNSRYYHEGRTQLDNRQIYRNLSSAIVWQSFETDATLIFFDNFYDYENIFPWVQLQFPDYTGRFLQITNLKNSGSRVSIDRLSDYNFDNRTSSLILLNTYSVLRSSFRDIFLNEWKTGIDSALGSDASRNGDPILTWEMWPEGISYLDPSRRYLKIHQDLRINVSFWPDYDASITYHIYLYLDYAGRLRGYVARWAYWVEGGLFSGSIADDLEPAVISGMDTINDRLAEQLDEFSSMSFSSLYYLPGRQLTYPPANVVTGLTTDDVTIVLEI